MFNQTTIQEKHAAVTIESIAQQYSVDYLVQQFYKASHRKKKADIPHFITDLELHVANFIEQGYQENSTATTETEWINILKQLCTAIALFEKNYNANCPFAGVLPSPFLKQLKRLEQQVKLALLYVAV